MQETTIHPDYPAAIPFRKLSGRSVRWRRRDWQKDDGTWSYTDLPGKPGEKRFHVRYHGLELSAAIKAVPVWRPKTKVEHFIDNLVKGAKSRSKGRVIDIDAQWVVEQCDKQGWCCALTGISFLFEANHRLRLYAPSMDRIDTKKGYTKGNVRIVILAMNIAMNDFGVDFFDTLAVARLNWKTTNPSLETNF